MNWLLLLALLQPVTAESPGGQAFRLGPGEYHFVELHISRAPTEVDVRFEVLQGNATVHAELLEKDEFRKYGRGRRYDAVVATPEQKLGGFHKVVLNQGEYAVVIANGNAAPAATVSLGIRVDADSRNSRSRELSPQRRITVILASFLFFIATVGWSGNRLIKAMNRD